MLVNGRPTQALVFLIDEQQNAIDEDEAPLAMYSNRYPSCFLIGICFRDN